MRLEYEPVFVSYFFYGHIAFVVMNKRVGDDLRKEPHEPVAAVRRRDILTFQFDNQLAYNLVYQDVLVHKQVGHRVHQIVPYAVAFEYVCKRFREFHSIDNRIDKLFFQCRITLFGLLLQ
jgi:hypothetical protein